MGGVGVIGVLGARPLDYRRSVLFTTRRLLCVAPRCCCSPPASSRHSSPRRAVPRYLAPSPCSICGSTASTRTCSSPATPRSPAPPPARSEEHTSELQSHGLISYAVFCLKKKKTTQPIYYFHSIFLI